MLNAKSIMRSQSSDTLQELATMAIEILLDRYDLHILKKIDGTIPARCFNDERIDSAGTREWLIKLLYDTCCDAFLQQRIADYTCDMASDEKLRESIDWREEMTRRKEEQESYRMERTLSAPQI